MSFFPFNSEYVKSSGVFLQTLVSLILVIILFLESFSNNLPTQLKTGFFLFIIYALGILLIDRLLKIMSRKDTSNKCHYCGFQLEISQYTCTNPMCGKSQ